MHKHLAALTLALATSTLLAAPPPTPNTWRTKVAKTLPLLGHRNWILIVDSAYPLQASPGVDTVDTNADQLEVVRYVLGAIGNSIHVRPDIFMDAELPFVPDQDAPGASHFRAEIGDLLRSYPVQALPHEQVISKIDESSKLFHVLVLKTNMAIPYTSVFIRLNCKYWGDDAEKRLRAKMSQAASAEAGAPR
jgi:hypothetical protein